MGKGKEAGAGRACAGGPVSMRENKSVSRRLTLLMQVMLLLWLTLLIQVMLLLWFTLLWGSCLWDAFCALCMGDAAAQSGLLR